MQVVLDTRGLAVSVRNHCFEFATKSEARIIHPNRITSILITAPCRISSPVLELATLNEIPVIICDRCGKPVVRTWSPHFINITSLRRKQYIFTENIKAAIYSAAIIHRKIEGQLSNMAYLADRKPSLANQLNKIRTEILSQKQKISTLDYQARDWKKKILFFEAFAASRYWQFIGLKLPEPYNFINRKKRNPEDVFNASINYLYGMLRNQVDTAISCSGLDPALGILHCDRYKQPSLAFDLMEPFRPVIDKILIVAILENKIKNNYVDFQITKRLSKENRKSLIELFNSKLQSRIVYSGSVTALKNHILTEINNMAVKIKEL